MKLLKVALGLLFTLVLCLGTTTFAADDIVIDVVNRELQVQGYRVELDDSEKPITVDLQNGKVVLYVKSTVGEVELNLGEGVVALTQRSVDYVQLTANAQGGPVPSRNPVNSGICRYCGSDNTKGIHYCPRCGLPYCKHNDFKCSYRMNPVPTPFSTVNPEGTKLTFYVSDDGTYYAGVPTYTKLPSIDSWRPGEEFGKVWATPSPTATYLIGPGATARP